MHTPEMKMQPINNGADPLPMRPAQYSAMLRSDSAKWAQVANAVNLRIE